MPMEHGSLLVLGSIEGTHPVAGFPTLGRDCHLNWWHLLVDEKEMSERIKTYAPTNINKAF